MDSCISSSERVLAALSFEKTDRVPKFETYWPEFVAAWRHQKGLAEDVDVDDYYANDVHIIAPDETPFPSQKAVLEEKDAYEIVRDGWGGVLQRYRHATFDHVLEVALPDKRLTDKLAFESPLLDARFAPDEEVAALKARYCAFVKTGGPYLRTSNLRGMNQWLMDLGEDEVFAHELAMRVTRHITAVGLEAIRRYDLYHTGIWFYDDMGSNLSPMFSPRTFERVFLPCYRWMCAQYIEAGVEHIVLHCDGNIASILDMLVDAGIQAFHPVEPKAGMDVIELRKKYGRSLAFLGGLDNAYILPRGDRAEVKAHVMHVLEAGQDGGLVIGAHSIGPDISVETCDLVHRLVLEHGKY